MTEESVEPLLDRINVLIALTLCQLEHRTEPGDVVSVLSRLGVQPKEIAKLLGMTPNAVSLVRYRQRRGGAKPKPRKRAK